MKPDCALPKLTEHQARILRLLADGRELYALDMLVADRWLKRGKINLDLARLRTCDLVGSRVVDADQGMLPRLLFRITDFGLITLGEFQKRKDRPGFLRRSWRRLRAVPCWYADEWRNDWLSMALSHVLLLSTLSLAALSAWGVIP